MSDRELLEKAASAAGLKIHARNQAERDALIDPATASLWIVNGSTAWNPLTDDGDCAWLEATCMLDVEWQTQHVTVGRTMLDKWQESYLLHDGDKRAARRYASVRSAAALAELSIPSQEVKP